MRVHPNRVLQGHHISEGNGVGIVSGPGEGGVGAWGIITPPRISPHISYQDKVYQLPSTSQLTFFVAWILVRTKSISLCL
jgi:hypothetical protein